MAKIEDLSIADLSARFSQLKEEMKMELALLAIALGIVSLVGLWSFFWWFKHTEKKDDETLHAN